MKKSRPLLALALLLALASCQPPAPAPSGPLVVLQFGPDVPAPVARRVEGHVRAAARRRVEVRPAGDTLAGLPPGSVVLAFGETTTTRLLIPIADRDRLGSEGLIVRSGAVGGAPALAADGNRLTPDPFATGPNLGLAYAAYRLLEEVGFAFLHPLEPTVPPAIADPQPGLEIAESPHWPVRAWQLHTMHPLELTDLLNGWGTDGPDDAAGWRSMEGDWEEYLEWSIANRQNRVHWVLLDSEHWREFSDSTVRRERLTALVDRAHAWGIAAGVDVPIALGQQHAWRLIRDFGNPADEAAQLRRRIDWLMAAGFDYLATEIGFSEFTHPDDRVMLGWMDLATRHMADAHGKPIYIKVHISSGQRAEHYLDPDTGLPINFNFLPHFADPRLGVMPHTVQHYALDDPAPTYGNSGFGHMEEFMRREAGRREVLWHPETAYWVSFDIDVPLFLPIYAERRLHDLRRIAADEVAGRYGRGPAAGSRIDGQANFSSGWEWGYWLGDVVTARAAWDPHLAEPDDEKALRAALAPVVRPFGAVAGDVADLLVDTIAAEQALLIEGRVGGVAPADLVARNGQAYLQGWETFDDVGALVDAHGFGPISTQPARLGHVSLIGPRPTDPDYWRDVEPLLAEMARTFESIARRFEALAGRIPAHARPLFDDLADSARMTAHRATQVHGLHDYGAGRGRRPDAWRQGRLATARQALDDAAVVVARREAAYRVDPERIAGWRDNPTSYEFTYLWTVRSLHYWWRDEGLAVDQPLSPAYLNLINGLDTAFGENVWTDAARLVRWVGDLLGWAPWLVPLLAEPIEEPHYPPDGLRGRS